MKTATRRRRLDGWSSEPYLWQMSPPLDGHEFVVTSAVVAPFSGPECYMFACDLDGEVTDWSEMAPSRRGTLDHLEIIRGAGYVPLDESGTEAQP